MAGPSDKFNIKKEIGSVKGCGRYGELQSQFCKLLDVMNQNCFNYMCPMNLGANITPLSLSIFKI